jgi:hypothetical protein
MRAFSGFPLWQDFYVCGKLIYSSLLLSTGPRKRTFKIKMEKRHV